MKNITHKNQGTLIRQKSNDIKFAPVLFLNSSSGRYKEYEKIDIKQKNPYLALFIAAVPGSIIHGLGHAYLEDTKTFKILFITELVSIPTAFVSFGMMFGDAWDRTNRFPLAPPMFFIALTAFIGTWVYDVVAAPIKARSSIIKRSSGFRFSQNVNYKSKTVSMNIAYCF